MGRMGRPIRLTLKDRFHRRLAQSKNSRMERVAAQMREAYLTPRRRAALASWARRKDAIDAAKGSATANVHPVGRVS